MNWRRKSKRKKRRRERNEDIVVAVTEVEAGQEGEKNRSHLGKDIDLSLVTKREERNVKRKKGEERRNTKKTDEGKVAVEVKVVHLRMIEGNLKNTRAIDNGCFVYYQ